MLFIYMSMMDTEEERRKIADIYEQHKYACLKIALKITNNQSMAEDAVHNAFLSIIKKKEKYLGLSCRDFRSLIVIIVKNKCLDLLKAGKKFSSTPVDEMEEELSSNDIPVDIQVIEQIDFDKLRKYMEKLDDISKQVLDMKYMLGMSYKEIGEELGMTPKHVDTRIMRAKAKVRKMLESEMGYHGS